MHVYIAYLARHLHIVMAADLTAGGCGADGWAASADPSGTSSFSGGSASCSSIIYITGFILSVF